MENVSFKGSLAVQTKNQEPPKIKYILYARKSTESEERQVLSIDSQIKEMLRIAERDNLEIVELRRESHSAKNSGERPVFNSLIDDIRAGKFNGILTWAPDRLSRNAGDLGSLVDLMDQKLLLDIQTYGQKFSNSPNEKFLLMILCSQAKLENDNRGVNVKRGLRTRAELGLRPGVAPTGYLNEKRMDRKCHAIIDPERAPAVKKMFEKVAYEGWSGRKLYHWLREELINQLSNLFDRIDVNELGIRHKFEEEVGRYKKFRKNILGFDKDIEVDREEIDIRTYAKYLLKEGTIVEKRQLLANMKSWLKLKNKQIVIEETK